MFWSLEGRMLYKHTAEMYYSTKNRVGVAEITELWAYTKSH